MPPTAISSRAGELLAGRQWAMLPDRLVGLRSVAEKVAADPSALTSWADAPVPATYLANQRDGVATIRVTGILQRQWDFWCWIFGGTAYEVVAKDLETLKRDPAVRAVILEFDSPGGDVAGCNELSGLIRAFDAEKPIVAHAAALCCSAAYWLASACREVIADPTAIVGSIGVISEFVDVRGWKEFEGIEFIELVSSQSPRKAMDPATRTGRADWQALLDALAAVFIATVARNRGVDEATVLSEFGQGGVFTGQDAIGAGLADALGTSDQIHAALLEELAAVTDLSAFALTEGLMAKHTTPAPQATRRRLAAAPVDPAARARAEGATDEDEKDKDAQANEDTLDDEKKDEEEPEATVALDVRLAGALTPEWLAEHAPAVSAAVRTAGATTERERILAIHQLGAKVKGEKAQAVIAAAMADPSATAASVALQLLEAGIGSGNAGASFLEARAGDEKNLNAPSNAAGVDATGDQAVVERISATYHANKQSRQAAAGRN